MAPTAVQADQQQQPHQQGAGEAASKAPMARSNRALVVTANGQVRMEETAVAEPGPDEVLLHVRATGICDSDIHFWHHGGIRGIRVDGDCVLGHEAAATVVKTGSAVCQLQAGDRVAIEPGVSCGHCFLCVGGQYNLCEAVAFAGVYPHAGSARRFMTHPARRVHRLPAGLSLRAAALLEPLSVALHALRTSPVKLGAPVAIFGAGPIGLLAMAAARASGAHPVVITDVDAARLAFARAFEPAYAVVRVRAGDGPADTAAAIRALFASDPGPDADAAPAEVDMPQLVLECTGIESSIATAAYTVRPGGCVNVGVSPRATIDKPPFMHLSLAEIKLVFTNRYSDTWPAAIRAVQGGLIDQRKLESLVTHQFPLEDAVSAMRLGGAAARRDASEPTVVKVHIVDEAAAGNGPLPVPPEG